MKTKLVGVLVVLFAYVAAPVDSWACSCAFISAEHYIENADWVFFAQAREPETQGAAQSQTLDVLGVIKGQPGDSVVLDQTPRPCSVAPAAGDIAVFFMKKDDKAIGLCSGNFSIQAQLRWFEGVISHDLADPENPGVIPLAAFERTFDQHFREVMRRKTVPVLYPPHEGQELHFSGITMPFVKEAEGDDIIVIEAAFSRDGLHYLRFRYPLENITASAIFYTPNGESGVKLLAFDKVESP